MFYLWYHSGTKCILAIVYAMQDKMSSGYYVILNNAVRNKMNHISLMWPDKYFCTWTLSLSGAYTENALREKIGRVTQDYIVTHIVIIS